MSVFFSGSILFCSHEFQLGLPRFRDGVCEAPRSMLGTDAPNTQDSPPELLADGVPDEAQQQQGAASATSNGTNVLTAAANLVDGDKEPDETLTIHHDEDDHDEYDDDGESDEEGGDGMVKRGRHTGAKSLFLQKLYDILENDENDEFISWANNGEHVLIKDPEGTPRLPDGRELRGAHSCLSLHLAVVPLDYRGDDMSASCLSLLWRSLAPPARTSSRTICPFCNGAN